MTEADAVGDGASDQAKAFFVNVAGEGAATTERIAIVTEMDEKVRGEDS